MGTGTCAVDGCTAREVQGTGRCANHLSNMAPLQADFSSPSPITFTHANFPTPAQTTNARVGGEGALVYVQDLLRELPEHPSAAPTLVGTLIGIGLILGSPILYIYLNPDWFIEPPDPTMCCSGMVFGLMLLTIISSRGASIRNRRWRALQQVAIAVDGNDARCPAYPIGSVTLLIVGGVILMPLFGLGLMLIAGAFAVDYVHNQKVRAFEAWARATYC